MFIYFCEGVTGITSNSLLYSLIEDNLITSSEQVHYQSQDVMRTQDAQPVFKTSSSQLFDNTSRESIYQAPLDDFEVQRIFALYSFYTTSANMILSSLVLMSMGSFSDRINEKTLLYVPVVGCTFFMAVQLYCSVAPNTPPLVLVVAYVFLGLGGSFQAMYAFAAGYMINRFQGDNRTTRLSILSGAQMAGKSIGSFSSGLFESLSLSGSFSACLVICLLSLFFIVIWLPPLHSGKYKSPSSDENIDETKTSFFGEYRAVLVIHSLCVVTSVISVGKFTVLKALCNLHTYSSKVIFIYCK